MKKQNVGTWVGVAALAALGCSDARFTERMGNTSEAPLAAAAQDTPRDAGPPQAANVGPSVPGVPGIYVPPPGCRISDPSWCNGGKPILNAQGSGCACDCRGTAQAGEFCERAVDDDDAGTAPPVERSLTFSSPYYSSCVIMEDQHVRCWGRNEVGELGDGTRTNRNVPTEGRSSAA